MSKFQDIADKIIPLMEIIDDMDKYDVELLTEAMENLKSNINHNETVTIIAMACGGDMYERDEDEQKIKELKAIIDLINARLKLKEVTIEKLGRQKLDGNRFYR